MLIYNQLMNFLKKFKLEKPYSATAEEWVDWDDNARKNYPIKYFLTETLPTEFSVFKHRINDLKWWVLYRTFHRYHVIKTGLKPGYHDCDKILLHTNFSILVNYVEIEMTSKSISMFYSKRKELYPIPWYWFGNYSIRVELHPEAGLDDLKSDMKLPPEDDPLAQVNIAKEIWILYHWWKNIRPNRPDPYEISGLEEWYKRNKPREENKSVVMHYLSDKGIDPIELTNRTKMVELNHKIGERYNQEDDDMLIRLMRIRRGLWT